LAALGFGTESGYWPGSIIPELRASFLLAAFLFILVGTPLALDSAGTLPRFFDVLIIGGGAAGLYTALCLPPSLQVGLITKDNLNLSASDWAQGGIAAAIAPEDSPQLHYEDTLQAGAGLCEPDAVRFLVQHAAPCIEQLIEMGVAFDRDPVGQIALTLEAAHSRNRVLHAADTTGHALVTTLAQQVVQRSNIQVLSGLFALDLWLHPETQHCQGVCVAFQNQVVWMASQSVILATGGGGQVYAQTTNPTASTGDGVAIAWRAGAELRDLEFFQFHPTALMKPGAPHFLISEAVRGEGAHLIDAQGRRFAFDYHPQGELAPRDVVSRAIFSHLQAVNASTESAIASVGLDLRPIPVETIQHRFPNIIQVCQKWGIDVFTTPIPVAPAAHYWMGGITTDLQSCTPIPGLYAIGETASTGIHGANRLASNSLLECVVFGQTIAAIPIKPLSPPVIEASSRVVDVNSAWSQDLAWIQATREMLPRLMWQSAGISRTQDELNRAIAHVDDWRSQFQSLPISQVMATLQPGEGLELPSPVSLRVWGELQNLLDIASLILRSAQFRTESRGGHYRADHAQSDSSWLAHTLVQGTQIYQSLPING
jgi:L-aspartate oxidase